MVRRPSSRRVLTQVLEKSSQPIYLLNQQRCVVFCNTSCLQWLQADESDVLGQTCRYQANPQRSDAVTAGLCPPPDGAPEFTAWSVTRTDGSVVQRAARVCRLSDVDSDEEFLFVCLADADQGDDQARWVDSEEMSLHDCLLELRRREGELGTGELDDCLLGSSGGIDRIRGQLKCAAATAVDLVLIGGDGSPIQQLAHQTLSQRLQRLHLPWISVDCELLGGDLLQSVVEATASHQGKDSYVVLFENVDRLATGTQERILSWIQSHGDQLTTAATSQANLFEVEGFCRRLAERLSRLVISWVPIGQRTEDIPLLVQSQVERWNEARSAHQQRQGMTPQALDLLVSHPWRGDYDELIAVVSAAHANAQGPLIDVDALPEIIRLTHDADAEPSPSVQPIDLDDYLQSIERELIERALRHSQGNRARAARQLGISRARLLRRLESFGDLGGDALND